MTCEASSSPLPMQHRRLLRINSAEARDALEHRLSSAKRLGFDGAELMVDGGAPGTAEPVRTVPHWLAELCLQHSMPVTALAGCRTAADPSAAADDVCSLLHMARMVGASFVNLGVGGASRTDPLAPSPENVLNLLHRMLHRVVFEVEASGAVLAVAADPASSGVSTVELRELIDGVNSWSVGACVDLQGSARMDSCASELATLGRRVFTLRLVDHGDAASAWECGQREAAALRRVLDSIGFEGAFVASRAELAQGLNLLDAEPKRADDRESGGRRADALES